jgi:hypothetical protein
MPEENSKGNVRPEAVEAARKYAIDNGIDVNSFKSNLDYTMSKEVPLEDTGLQEDYEVEDVEFEQNFLSDLGSAFANSLVLDTGEGLANLIPTIAQASGADFDFVNSWKENVSSYFDDQKMIYSDSNAQEINEFGDINSSHVATGIGQGLGFIAGIMAGGAGAGKIASSLGNSGKMVNAASKIGTFFTGTTMMYSGIDKEAKRAGLNNVDAARFALAVSGLVSLTEGAALESIGKIATKPLTAGVAGQIAKKTLKEAAGKSPKALQKLFLKNYSKQFGGAFNKGIKSAGIEMGQEFSQTYIEEGAKNLYDVVTEGEDKGHFGTDVTSYETFVSATFAGAIGGLLGGGMGVSLDRATSKGESLAEESLSGYVNSSIKLKKTENIDKLKSSVEEMLGSGDINEEQAANINSNIDNLVEFHTDMKATDINDGVAEYQLFQLDRTKKDINAAKESEQVSENANESTKKFVEEKKSKMDLVAARVQENFDALFESKKPEGKNKTKFENKIAEYEKLTKDIQEKGLTEEEVNTRLDKIYNPTEIAQKKAEKQAKKETSKKAAEPTATEFGNEYKTKDGGTVTDFAIENKDDIVQNIVPKLFAAKKDEAAKEKILAEAKEKYGVDKEGISALMNNETFEQQETPSPKEDLERPYKDLTDVELDEILESRKDSDVEGSVQEELRKTEVSAIEKEIELRKKSPTKPLKTKEEIDIEKRREEDLSKIDTKETAIGSIYYAEGYKSDGTFEGLEKVINDKYDTEIAALESNENDGKDLTDISFDDTGKPEPTIVPKTNTTEEVEETPIPSTELSNEDIQEELAETEVTEARKSELIAEQVKRAEVAEKNSTEQESKKKTDLISFLDGFNVEQRERSEKKPNDELYDNSLVRDNPELYTKIKNHFGKIFPNLSVKEVSDLGSKYGAKILARIVDGGIEINKNEAIQSSLIHEYAHVYLEILGDNHPLVKAGYEMIEGTQFDLDAIALYPDKTRKEQLNEALTEALAQDSLSKLKVKFEGSALEKFKEFAKRFWNKIKRFFSKSKSRDIVGILTDGLILKNKPYSVGIAALSGMNKNQRKADVNPRFLKTVDLVSSSLMKQQIDNITDKKFYFDRKNKEDLIIASVGVLMKRYNAEKEGNLKVSDDLVFDGIDMGNTDLTYENILSFADNLKKNQNDIYQVVDRVVNSMMNTNLEISEEEINEDQNQDVDGTPDSENNSVKASKKINSSVRAILGMIVDANGYKMNADLIYQYISNASQKTYKQRGLAVQMKADADADNIIAKRLITIISKLDKGQKAGVVKTLSSLIQVQYEGSNIYRQENEDGSYTYRLTNHLKNKDKNLGQVKLNFDSWKGTQDGVFFSEMFDKGYQAKIKRRDMADLKPLMEVLSKLYGLDINATNINGIIDSFGTATKTSDEDFFTSLAGKYHSFSSYFNGQNQAKEETVWSGTSGKKDGISGWATKIYEGATDESLVQNTFLNGSGNTVSSTQTGHWISELNSMFENEKESKRIETMQKSIVYENNSVLEYFKKKGKVNYVKHDSMKNLNTLENAEYSQQNKNDYSLNQLFKFATNTASEYYKQTLGVMSNRDSVLMFDVPTYTATQLDTEYKKQAASLEKLLKQKMKGLTTEQKEQMRKDFNNLYIHQADANGIVTPGNQLKKKYEGDIQEIKDLLSDNGLTDAFSQTKVGKGKKYSTIDEMVDDYFYTEALNRTYLNDIYGGSALHFSNPNSSKRAVEQAVKRLSGPSSNGEIIELDRPVMMVYYDGGKPDGDNFVGDSFAFNGTELSKKLQEMSGSLDPMGINSKDQVYQVDPTTGKSLYLKRSTLNVMNTENGTNLDGMGEGYANVAKLIKNIEKQHTKDGVVPYVMIMDDSATKGSEQPSNVYNLEELMKQGEAQTLPNFESVKLDNYRVLFNLNKTLKHPSEQSAIFSTQAANIQFNNASQSDIDSYDDAVVNYLKSNLRNSRTMEKLLSYNSTIREFVKDLEDREKTSTSELLKAVEAWNNNPSNAGNLIESFDDPSLRMIYEQFVSSRLTKKGIKLDMAGNFMHQLPDMQNGENKLHGFEVAVSYKMFADKLSDAKEMLAEAQRNGKKLEVAVVRIPASAEMSMFAGEVKYFLDTDASVVTLSDKFVHISDSDHDGDKAMVYRKEINEDGTFNKFSPKTRLFNEFYKNISKPQFVQNSLENTLDFKDLRKVLTDVLGEDSGSYSLSTVNDMVDIATKMKMGADATGRFAIAGKMMAYLSQAKEKLNTPIKFGVDDQGKAIELQEFNNNSLDKLAVFLQAALDIGNDPILPMTGINGTTIDVGNAMLLLGVDDKPIIEFLTSEPILEMVEAFDNQNLLLKDGKKISFNQFFKKNYPADVQHSEEIEKYREFKEVSDGLAKVISYIQLDKGLPNNADLNAQLLQGIKEFGELPFSTDSLVKRASNQYRVSVAEKQKSIYEQNLLTANPEINNVVEKLAEKSTNAFEFKKRFKEQMMMSIAQKQVSKQRDNVEKFIGDFSNRMKSIYDAVVLGKSDSAVSQSTMNLINQIDNVSTVEEQEAILDSNAKGYNTTVDLLKSDIEEARIKIHQSQSVDKFNDNAFFENLEFRELTKGSEEVIVSLSPKFKATDETMKNFQEGFKEIQKLDPQLAKEIIDYQLYRYGTNNKIGSFIDGLPMDIRTKALLEATKIKKSISEMNLMQEADELIDPITGDIMEMKREEESSFNQKYKDQLRDNLAGANADLIKKITYQKNISKMFPNGDLELNITEDYVNYEDVVYKHKGRNIFTKLPGFESNANFTSYNIADVNTSTQEEIDEIKKCINGKVS